MERVEKVWATVGLGEACVLKEAHANQCRYECTKTGGTSTRSDGGEQWYFKTCTGQTHVASVLKARVNRGSMLSRSHVVNKCYQMIGECARHDATLPDINTCGMSQRGVAH